MVIMALQNLASGDELDVIFIENVGNLICPGGIRPGVSIKE
jgi:Ni2+-binding GTPase involved in maturation of urease and hydrogenase